MVEAGLRLRLGDIVDSRTAAVVNAANSRLRAGGGVDGAIHRAAGPELQRELRRRHPGGCPTGQAVATPGFGMAVKVLIHAVGPVWQGGGRHEVELLRSAYRASFGLAEQWQCESVAAPAISTGIFGFPMDLAAPVAVAEARRALAVGGAIREVEFVLRDQGALALFDAQLMPPR